VAKHYNLRPDGKTYLVDKLYIRHLQGQAGRFTEKLATQYCYGLLGKRLGNFRKIQNFMDHKERSTLTVIQVHIATDAD
jgi:hypothetical protein